MDLADNKCVPCRGGVPPMDRAKAEEMLKQLDSGWALNKDGQAHLVSEYAQGTRTGAVGFAHTVLFHVANQVEKLFHGKINLVI